MVYEIYSENEVNWLLRYEYIFLIMKSSSDGLMFFWCVQGQPGISGPPGLKGVAVSLTPLRLPHSFLNIY